MESHVLFWMEPSSTVSHLVCRSALLTGFLCLLGLALGAARTLSLFGRLCSLGDEVLLPDDILLAVGI